MVYRNSQDGRLNDLAAERGQSLAEMALSWILRDGIVNSVLAGASKPSQILENLGALKNTAFTEEEIKRIDEASAGSIRKKLILKKICKNLKNYKKCVQNRQNVIA